MKAVFFDGELKVVDIPKPAPEGNEVLIRVTMAGICNTDLEIIKGYRGFQGILGHEFTGIVEDAAPNYRNRVGKRVVGEINCGCGACNLCRAGLEKHCDRRTTIGISGRPGCFADYLTLPVANIHEIPETVAYEEAVFTEPLAAAFEIREQCQVQSKDRVLILGDGKLGILCAAVLQLTGAHVTLAGKHTGKLNVASGQGVHAVKLEDLPKEKLFDIVVEATGNADGVKIAMNMTRARGTIILKSAMAHAASCDLTPVVIREITMIGSRCGPFEPALDAIARRTIDVRPLITGIYPLRDSLRAFAEAQESDALKVLIDFRNETE